MAGAGNQDELLVEIVEVFGEEEEELAGSMRQAMEKLVAALVAVNPEPRPTPAVDAALDGAELVTRAELTNGGPPTPSCPSRSVEIYRKLAGGVFRRTDLLPGNRRRMQPPSLILSGP